MVTRRAAHAGATVVGACGGVRPSGRCDAAGQGSWLEGGAPGRPAGSLGADETVADQRFKAARKDEEPGLPARPARRLQGARLCRRKACPSSSARNSRVLFGHLSSPRPLDSRGRSEEVQLQSPCAGAEQGPCAAGRGPPPRGGGAGPQGLGGEPRPGRVRIAVLRGGQAAFALFRTALGRRFRRLKRSACSAQLPGAHAVLCHARLPRCASGIRISVSAVWQ